MAGKTQKPARPIDRIHRAYRDWCLDFAQTFGCEPDWLANWFEQFTFMRQAEQGMHKNLAAYMAQRDCVAFFAKVGNEPD